MTKTIADYEKRTIEGLTETDEELLKTEKYKKNKNGQTSKPINPHKLRELGARWVTFDASDH